MELKINGEIMELGNSLPSITKKSIDINNPSARYIDISNSFQLPDTSKNRQLLGSPKAIGSDNKSYDKKYNAVVSDVFQIFSGDGFLSSSTKNKYSFQIVDRSKELFKALEIELKDVSWDDQDTTLKQSSIDSLSIADVNTCWVWGKACFHEQSLQIHTDQTTGDDRCKYSRPSFYVQGLLKRIIESLGYSYSLGAFDLAISSCHSDFFFTSYQKTLSGDYVSTGTLALTGLITNDFAHPDLVVSTGSINIGISYSIFRLRGSIVSDSQINIIIRAIDNIDPTKVSESKISLNEGLQNIDFSSSEFFSEDGYTIDIRFEGIGTVNFDDVLLYTILSDQNKDLSTNPWLNYMIKVYDNLPELTYLDLFRLICVTSHQYQIIDSFKKTFEWGSLSRVNKINSVDWSDKFIIGSENISSKFKGLYQKNILRYENDITVNPKLGWFNFTSDNKSFDEEGDYIVLKFSASNDVIINTSDVAHIKVYNDTTRIPDQEINIRLFSINGTQLQFTPLHWENISNNYYKNWFNSLFRIRQIDADFNLNKLDVLSWHENQLVYIDYFKTTFIVLEISNFIPRRKTKVKLLAYGR